MQTSTLKTDNGAAAKVAKEGSTIMHAHLRALALAAPNDKEASRYRWKEGQRSRLEWLLHLGEREATHL